MSDLRYHFEEYCERLARKAAIPNVLAHAFDKQKEFINDPSKQKALFCTRRSAKSFTAGLYLVKTALENPGGNCLFIGLTRASAKAIIWNDILSVIDRGFDLGAKFNQADLRMTFPNRASVTVTGIDVDEREMNKLLGPKYRIACIDEASMYTVDMRNFVYGILGPAVVDPNEEGESGTIAMFGTASDLPRGLFYDITTDKERGWEVYEWTAYDNPYVAKQWGEAIERIERERPEYMETPQFQQWYLNKWVIDDEKRVYKFNTAKNLCRDLPNLPYDGWTFVLGIDTGWEDDNAFVLTGYHTNDPHLYVIKTYARKKMTFDEVCAYIEAYFMADRHFAPHKIIIDGANKQGVESMRARSSIPFEYADKQDKATFIELANADFVQGKIKILNTDENRPFWLEMSALVWMTDGDKIKYPKKEHPALPNHRCDGFLYAWRCGYHYSSRPEEKKTVVGSRQWYLEQSENIWERERERLIQPSDWPEEGSLGDLG